MMIVVIDGPAGAGKSTVARAVSARLGFAFLDTGALYRVSVLAARQTGLLPHQAAEQMNVQLGTRVLLDGRDVSDEIRKPEISAATPQAAKDPALRAVLLERQRQIVTHGDWVAEGRDLGTVVFPDAELKVFLTASDTERATRRARETGRSVAEELADLRERDHHDMTREHAPLDPADDAMRLDTTGMSLDEVVEHIVGHLPAHRHAPPRLFATAAADIVAAPHRKAGRRVR